MVYSAEQERKGDKVERAKGGERKDRWEKGTKEKKMPYWKDEIYVPKIKMQGSKNNDACTRYNKIKRLKFSKSHMGSDVSIQLVS
jgi:hypothetical protein